MSTRIFNKNSFANKNKPCHFYARGICRNGSKCNYLHIGPSTEAKVNAASRANNSRGSKVEVEEAGALTNMSQNSSGTHNQINSKDKSCGICFEEVVAKPQDQNSFGLLPNCNHCFCFMCIKKWRESLDFENIVKQSCPECRVVSNYVYKSKYWLDTEEKEIFIAAHNEKLSNVHCRNFKKGKGRCRHGNKCLFRHALRDGTLYDVGPPGVELRFPGEFIFETSSESLTELLRISDHFVFEDDPELYALENDLSFEFTSDDEIEEEDDDEFDFFVM